MGGSQGDTPTEYAKVGRVEPSSPTPTENPRDQDSMG
jgi:hypothetical protein